MSVIVTVGNGRYDMAIVLPREDADARGLLKLATVINTVVCLVAGVGLAVFAEPLGDLLNAPTLVPFMKWMGLLAWLTGQVASLSYWATRRKAYRQLGSNKITQSATTIGSQLAFGGLGFGASGLIVGTMIGQGVGATTLFLRNRRQILGQPTTSSREMMREHRKMPLLNGPTALLDSVRTSGLLILLKLFFNDAAVGVYSVATKVLQIPAGLINSSLAQVFFERLARTPRGRMLSTVRQAVFRSLLIGLIPFALIFVLAPRAFLLFRSEWALVGPVCSAMVPWMYMNFVTSPISTLFVVLRRQGILLWFAFPFTAAPLLTIFFWRDPDIVVTVWRLSLVMAGMLGVFVGLALMVARQFDDRVVEGG